MLHRTASSALTITRSQIRTAKYVREGIWARGDYGLYTMDDPRIFRPGLRRQYPYHKQLQWSKPYMCLRHGRAAPPGGAVHLAVVYRQFELAPAFYDFQRRLKCELPGAKVVAEAVDPNTNASTDSYFQIIRLNDGRTLWAASETEEVKNRLSELEAKRKEFQKAKEDQQHLKAQTADVVLDFRFQACPPKVDETAEWAMAIRHTVAAEAGLHKDQVQVTQSKEANQIIIATIPCADPGSAAVVAHGLLATDGACRLCLAVSEELAKTASGDAARELVERPELRVQVKMGGRGGEVQGRDVEQSEKRVALLPKKMTKEAQQSSVNLLEEVLLSELCQEVSSLLRQRLPQIVQAAQEHFHIRYEAAWPEPAEAAWPEL